VRAAPRLGGSALLAAALAAWPLAAHAWEGATTNAGLTERAAMASRLHRVLAAQLGRPLGLFEPLALRAPSEAHPTRGVLWDRLATLDPGGGYRPDDGQQSALAWVVAGSVLAKVPAERARHHFFDPSTGRGLHDQGDARALFYSWRGMFDGDSGMRGLATGTSFDLSGRPALDWVVAADNEQSLPVFFDRLEGAVAGADQVTRDDELAGALLALGGVLAILEDAGEPARVRNDFAGAFLGTAGSGGWDRASSFERLVAERWGRSAVPAPAAAVSRSSWRAYFSDADGRGLADLVHRGYFSAGTLPADGVVGHGTTPADVRHAAQASLRYPQPAIGRLDLSQMGRTRYLVSGTRKLLAYTRVPGRVRFALDEAVMVSSGEALLPLVGSYATGLVDHLLRGSLTLTVGEGRVEAALGAAARSGRLRLYAQDAIGNRRLIGDAQVAAPVEAGAAITSAAVPAGTKVIAAVFRGQDEAGELVAVSEKPWSP